MLIFPALDEAKKEYRFSYPLSFWGGGPCRVYLEPLLVVRVRLPALSTSMMDPPAS